MLSPPSRMCSPTATRSRARSPSRSRDRDQAEVGGAAADVADEDQVADRDAPAPAVAERRRARRRTPPAAPRAASRASRPAAAAACSVSSRASSSNDAGTVSSTSCCDECAACACRPRRPDRTRRRDAAGTRPRRRPGRCAGLRSARPTAGSAPSGSRRRARATTSRWRRAADGFSAPRLRATSPMTLRGRWIPGQSEAACGKVDVAGDVEERRQQRHDAPRLARVDELRDRPAAGWACRRPRTYPPTRARSSWCRDRCRQRSGRSREDPVRRLRLRRARRRCWPVAGSGGKASRVASQPRCRRTPAHRR